MVELIKRLWKDAAFLLGMAGVIGAGTLGGLGDSAPTWLVIGVPVIIGAGTFWKAESIPKPTVLERIMKGNNRAK